MPGGESAIVDCLAREVAHNTSGRSMGEICKSLLTAHETARTRMETTTEFGFIKRLVVTVSVFSQDLPAALGDDVRLRVQEQDLENIVKAINTFTPFGPPCTPPAAIYQAYLASHDSQPDLGVARIRKLYTQSWLIELREKWRHEQEPDRRQSQVLDEPRLIQHGQGHPISQLGQDSVALSRPTYQALTLPSSRRTAPAANNSQPPKPPSEASCGSKGYQHGHLPLGATMVSPREEVPRQPIGRDHLPEAPANGGSNVPSTGVARLALVEGILSHKREARSESITLTSKGSATEVIGCGPAQYAIQS